MRWEGWGSPFAVLVVVVLSAGGFAVEVTAAPAEAEGSEKTASNSAGEPPPEYVLTFYGLLKVERDPSVSDAEKLKQWQEFISRARDQIGYAKKAVQRWKNAAKTRLIESAAHADLDPQIPAEEKVKRWREVAGLYPRTREGRRAKKRVVHWQRVETKRRAEAAEAVERARRPKVERIHAWSEVLEWSARGPEARAADRRVHELARQLYSEAVSVDRITRVDAQTKLAAWRDVLAGRPTPKERQVAERRVTELESEVDPAPEG